MTQSYLNPASILEQLDLLHNNMTAADFGCGSGYFTLAVANVIGSGTITAIDVLESALASLQSQARIKGFTNIRVVRGNLEAVNGSTLANESQDLVLLVNVLFMSQKKDAIMQEAQRVLKPGGDLLVIDWKPGTTLSPRKGYLSSVTDIEAITSTIGLKSIKTVATDAFHYGLLLQKS